jgi:hypothetical protein
MRESWHRYEHQEIIPIAGAGAKGAEGGAGRESEAAANPGQAWSKVVRAEAAEDILRVPMPQLNKKLEIVILSGAKDPLLF